MLKFEFMMKTKIICLFICLLTFAACQQKKNILSCYISSIKPENTGDVCHGWQGDAKLHVFVKNDNDRHIYFPLVTVLKDKKGKVIKQEFTLSVMYKGKEIDKGIIFSMPTETIPSYRTSTLEIIIERGNHNPAILAITGKPVTLKIKDFKIRYHIYESSFPRDQVCDSLTCITYPSLVYGN